MYNKLQHLGVCGSLCPWFESHLRGRTQCVQSDPNKLSDKFKIHLRNTSRETYYVSFTVVIIF